MYGYVRYLLPDDTPTPMVKYVRITHYANSNLFHDKLTGNYVMGIYFIWTTKHHWIGILRNGIL